MKLIEPCVPPPLDPDFRPISLANREFVSKVRDSGKAVPLRIAVERENGLISVYETQVYDEGAAEFDEGLQYVERLVKTLLWARGGWRVVIGGPKKIGEYIQQVYSPEGERAFDYDFMGRQVYEKEFVVEVTGPDQVPDEREASVALGRHLDGCRIGLDLGASDRKVSSVIEGEAIFAEEVVWNPKPQSRPSYHYHHIMSALHAAAAALPRVDAIGVSSAGIYIDNRVRVASLFRGVPEEIYDPMVTDLFLRIREDWHNVPLQVANDGDVTALAGAMNLGDNGVLGIAMGSSEAGGFVNAEGNITGWLNELAFVPVDLNPQAPVDEWSGDAGCGVQYFSQECVSRLIPAAGLDIDMSKPKPEQLVDVQEAMAKGDQRAAHIYETIGAYLGYALAYYYDLYQPRHVLILGRVTTGDGGRLIVDIAKEVLSQEFPEVGEAIEIHMPEKEEEKRVGQAIAAASLPEIGGEE
ncbi:MAG: ROK family protein [Armatimonadetes bacterium]|nr:ROK family protein [Armatimonadota bacterium]